jgi:hypothetical protein
LTKEGRKEGEEEEEEGGKGTVSVPFIRKKALRNDNDVMGALAGIPQQTHRGKKAGYPAACAY